MFIAKKYFETNSGAFKKGVEVPADIAAKYFRNVEEVSVTDGPIEVEKKDKDSKVKEPENTEGLLYEAPSAIETTVEIADPTEDVEIKETEAE